MAEHQNVTVSLSPALLREARHLAVDRGVSLSRFVAMLLEEHVESVKRYEAARQRQREMMRHGFDFGTQGSIRWSRDELHVR